VVGFEVGKLVGAGDRVGTIDGWSVGGSVGTSEGIPDGLSVGKDVGGVVGACEGCPDGAWLVEGTTLGSNVGACEATSLGSAVAEGIIEIEESVGPRVGDSVGGLVATTGLDVGVSTTSSIPPLEATGALVGNLTSVFPPVVLPRASLLESFDFLPTVK